VSTGALLQVEGLCRRFGGLKAVDGLALTLQRGQILGLLGPNGSGKSTALNLISGVLKPDQGSVRLAGREMAGRPSYALARHGMARTFQLVRTFATMTARENVAAGLAFAGPRRFGHAAQAVVGDLLARVGLSSKADFVASQLTYIDQKRLELARALASEPQVLLLDEWLAGLNPTELVEAISLLEAVRGDGVSILMVEHVLDAVRSLCDHCVVMNAGVPLAEGTPASVLSHPEVVRAYLGSEDA
jgi:branched-chain amino acid transport system ATP-binding protein